MGCKAKSGEILGPKLVPSCGNCSKETVPWESELVSALSRTFRKLHYTVKTGAREDGVLLSGGGGGEG